jgi:predicted enzyme related to lactoylglutathione lyase
MGKAVHWWTFSQHVADVAHAGAVLYAKNVQRLVAFYAAVAGLTVRKSRGDYVILDSAVFQLVILQIPKQIADSIVIEEPPVRRERAAIKLVLFVASIKDARLAASALGGELNSVEREWEFEGHKVCDGHDPEGNVFQLREAS